jgi:hypothetical protein
LQTATKTITGQRNGIKFDFFFVFAENRFLPKHKIFGAHATPTAFQVSDARFNRLSRGEIFPRGKMTFYSLFSSFIPK